MCVARSRKRELSSLNFFILLTTSTNNKKTNSSAPNLATLCNNSKVQTSSQTTKQTKIQIQSKRKKKTLQINSKKKIFQTKSVQETYN